MASRETRPGPSLDTVRVPLLRVSSNAVPRPMQRLWRKESARKGSGASKMSLARPSWGDSKVKRPALREVMAQADKAFHAFEQEVLNPRAVYARIDQWAKACKSCGSNVDCQNHCYQNHYLEFMKQKVVDAFGKCE